MTLDEYTQYVEAQRLSSLGIALEALLKSKAIQAVENEQTTNYTSADSTTSGNYPNGSCYDKRY